MSIEQGIVAHLLADGPTAAIVGTRVHPGAIPQEGTLPAVVYARVSTQRDVDLSGPMDFVQVRMRLDLWDNSYAGVKALADAVRVALNGVGLASPHLLGAEPVQLVYLDNDGDLPDFEGDRRDYRVSQDWIVIHLET
jgi:hypothetical protein